MRKPVLDEDIGARGQAGFGEMVLGRVAQMRITTRIAPEVEAVAAVNLDRQRHVLRRGEIGQDLGDLKRPGKAATYPGWRFSMAMSSCGQRPANASAMSTKSRTRPGNCSRSKTT